MQILFLQKELFNHLICFVLKKINFLCKIYVLLIVLMHSNKLCAEVNTFISNEDSNFNNNVEIRSKADEELPIVQNLEATVAFNKVTLNWRKLDEYEKYRTGFEDEIWPPANWSIKTSRSIDGELNNPGSNTWFDCDDMDFGDYGYKYIKEGDYSAAIKYFSRGFNWLISPELQINNGDELRFWLYYTNRSSEGGNHTNFRVMIKENNTWNQELFYSEESNSNHFNDEIIVDLQKYSGKNIQIAFVYEYTGGYSLAIDNVRLYATRYSRFTDNFGRINIYKQGEVVGSVNDATINTWEENGLETGKYTYEVSFVDTENKESDKSERVRISAFEKREVPFNDNFENENNNWIFNTNTYSFRRAQQSDFNTDEFTFPEKDGFFIGVNTKAERGNYLRDLLPIAPLDLSKYGRVILEFDYFSDVSNFSVMGRKTTESEWEKIEQLESSENWKHQSITLPIECLTNGYQLGLSYSTNGRDSNGIGIDNITINSVPGKKIEINYKDSIVDSDDKVDLGLVKPESSKDYSFTITNIGSENVNLNNVVINDDSFVIRNQPLKSLLSPKEKTTFTITYTSGVESENFDEADITINSDIPGEAINFSIKAKSGLPEWTYMLYLYEDGTGLDGNKDLNEWEQLGSIPGKVNYIALYDCNDDSKDGIYYISKDNPNYNRKLISKRISEEFNEGLDMNNAETLERFILWCKENYPAKHYGCNVWDHGTGIFRRSGSSIKSACGEMKLWDLANAVKEFKEVDGKGFDIFGFDVCLLGQVETVYALKDYVDIVIASEKTEPGDGWHYKTHFDILNDNPQVDKYKFAEHIVLKYDESYDFGIQGDRATTQTAVRTDYFKSDFIPALNTFADSIIPEIYHNNSLVTGARTRAWYSDGAEYKEHKDLGHFLNLLKNERSVSDNTKEDIDNLLQAYKKCIVATAENQRPNATGLKIWLPDNIYNSSDKEFYLDGSKYLKISETKWDEFLKQYSDPAWHGKPKPIIQTKGILSGREQMIVKFMDKTKCVPKIDNRKWVFTPNTVEILENKTDEDKDIRVRFLEAGEYSVSLEVSNNKGTSRVSKENLVNVRELIFTEPVNLTSTFENNQLELSWESNLPENRAKTVRYSEGFEQEWPPEGWSVKTSRTLNGDLSEIDAARSNSWQKINPASYNANGDKYIHEGNHSASINYTARGFNWLITNDIEVEIYDKLNFWLYYKDGLGGDGRVYHTRFRLMIHSDNRWEEIIYMYESENNEYDSAIEIDLAKYLGKTIKVAFVQEYTDGFQIAIDNVKIYRDAEEGSPDGFFQHYNIYRNGEKIDESENESFTQNIEEAGEYSYYITSVYNNLDGESVPSNTINIIKRPRVYSAPVNLTTELIDSEFRVRLNWEDGEGDKDNFQTYRIYRNNVLLTTTSDKTFTDNLEKQNAEYTYKVTSIYTEPNKETEASNEKQVSIVMKGAVPTNLTAVLDESNIEVTLNWENGDGANADLVSYKIYRNNELITTTTDRSYTDRPEKKNAEYQYKVSAVYAAPVNETASSEEQTVFVKMKGAVPTNLTAVLDESSLEVTLNWDSGNGANAELISYKVYRNNQVIITTTDRSFVDRPEKQSADYIYKVTAVYAEPVGETSSSNEQNIEVVCNINDFSLESVKVHPNPNNGKFFISSENLTGANWYIYSISGLLKDSGEIVSSKTKVHIDSSGIFILKIEINGRSTLTKVIIN